MSILEDLRMRGLVESVSTDRPTAAQWLDDAERHLKAARQIAELDPAGSYVLAYDAARKSVAAALLMDGHRVLSRPGAHRALAEYSDWLATETGEQALTRFDRMRRNRNRSEYGSRTFGRAEVAEAVDSAEAIRAACAKRT
ncbi:MAG TPA: HEPN domain-containing protein [Acidimicrobiia bacterium]|nr:HEPN domain-containing protein [Acidimicrobiia bacterium]